MGKYCIFAIYLLGKTNEIHTYVCLVAVSVICACRVITRVYSTPCLYMLLQISVLPVVFTQQQPQPAAAAASSPGPFVYNQQQAV